MSEITGSFHVEFVATVSTAGYKTTFSSFQFPTVFSTRFAGHTNALVFTVDGPTSLTLVVDTPGTLGS